jgi:nucleoside-diphosphate-sugar epimerase
MSKKSSTKSKPVKRGERILVTGGLGFIGAYVVKRLLDMGDEVLIYDNLKSYVPLINSRFYPESLRARVKMLGNGAQVIEGDVRDLPSVRSAVGTFKPEKVIHLAGLPIADKSDKYPHEAVSVNYVGTVNMLDACREIPGFKRFVNISSSMVYGDFQIKPCPEDHPLNPKGVYGATKLSAEIMTRMYAERYGFDYINIRPSSVYGPMDSNHRVSQLLVERALAGEPLILHNGGRSELDFTYVEDTADGIVLAVKRDDVKNDVFNITRGEGRSLAEFATLLKKHVPKAKVKMEEVKAEDKRPERGALDISKARKALGYKPKWKLEDGMERYIKFVKDTFKNA